MIKKFDSIVYQERVLRALAECAGTSTTRIANTLDPRVVKQLAKAIYLTEEITCQYCHSKIAWRDDSVLLDDGTYMHSTCCAKWTKS